MDKQLSKQEKRRILIKRYTPAAIVAAVILVIVIVLMLVMRASVSRGDLMLSCVDRGTIQTSVSASGKVVPGFEQIINSPITTRIVEVYCAAGDSVDEGTPLLRLDLQSAETELNKFEDEIQIKCVEMDQIGVKNSTSLADLEMRVEVKAMEVDRLEVELRNERYLDSIGSGTGDRVRQAELAYNTGCLELKQLRQQLESSRSVAASDERVKGIDISIARKNLAEMSRKLEDARIKSPRRATLTYIVDQIGQQVNEGQQIAIVSDLSHFKVDGEIADAYGDNISVGSRAVVRIGGKNYDGTVVNLTPLSKNGVLEFSVRLDDDGNPRLRSGLKSEIYVLCDVRENVLRIRNGAYYKGPGSYQLFVVEDDSKLVRRTVRLGSANYDYVEVVDGLSAGEEVVTGDMSRFGNSRTITLKK